MAHANYTPPAFVPDPALVQLHSLTRVQGGNTFPTISTALLAQLQSRQGPAVTYFQGVVAPSVVLVLVFIVWACFACCIKCCFPSPPPGAPRRNTWLGILLFILCGVGSCISWFIAMGGNAKIGGGVQSILKGGRTFLALGDTASGIVNDTVALMNSLDAVAIHANTSCTVAGGVLFPVDSISKGIEGVRDSIANSGSGLTAEFDQFKKSFATISETVNHYVGLQQSITWAIIITTLVFTAVFTFTSTVRMFPKTPEVILRFSRILSKCLSYVIFILGPLLLLLITILCAVLNVLAIVGSDFCVPDPAINLNKILGSQLGFSEATCDIGSSFQVSSTGNMLCYYETCKGNNTFGNILGGMNINSLTSVSALDDFKQNVSSMPPPYNESAVECIQDMDRLNYTFTTGINNITANISDLVSCGSINPIFIQFVNTGLCNGIFAGLSETTEAIIAAAIFLMITMLIYRAIDLSSIEDTAHAPYNYPVGSMSTGGHLATAAPIVVGMAEPVKVDPYEGVPSAIEVKG